MQTCWNCGAKQLDGTAFCSDCGASILNAPLDKETTASLGTRIESDRAFVQPVSVAPFDGMVSMVIINSGRRLSVDIGHDVLVGREDRANGFKPDIDLGAYGGYDAGVSRRHARIALHNDDYLIEDLGSANGTYLNGKRLAPRQPVALSNGDELGFGTMLLRVEF